MQSRRKFIRNSALFSAALPFSSSLFANKNFNLLNETVKTVEPPSLKTGDTVAIVSPAGAIWEESTVSDFQKILKTLGLKIYLGKSLTQKYGFLAGNDQLRADEINACFTNEKIKAIFCAKGGWGCGRILPLLDYTSIQKNPKIIMGFSDITSLLLAITSKSSLITYHGPVGNSSWGNFSMHYVKEVLFTKNSVLFQPPFTKIDSPLVLNEGKAKGKLIGGNLSVLTSIIGTPYMPDCKNAILFLEETAEEPYRLDRMLTQLKLCGILNSINGFVFGKCSKCEAEEPEKAFTFNEILQQHITPLNIPAFSNSMIGHVENKFTLPVGAEVEMNAKEGSLYYARNR